jgi:hypothetical protein
MDDNFSKMKSLRKEKKLHSIILDELKKILVKYFPEYIPISEIQGLAGGRNDLICFKYNSQKILFEIFATASQVSRDLRLLDKTDADIKIAIIIDKEIDNKVIEKFLRENPENNYPYFFMSMITNQTNNTRFVAKLREIIYKKDIYKAYEIIKKKISYKEFVKQCKNENIKILTSPLESEISFKDIFMTYIANKILKITHDNEKTVNLLKWLSDDKLIEFIVFKVGLGFNIFIFSDLNETYCIESDIEFQDWLHIMNKEESPFIILSINKIVYDINKRIYKNSLDIDENLKFTIGQSQMIEEKNGNVISFSIPKNTKKIILYKPMIDDNEVGLNLDDYKKMIELI